jgi:nijmegen breakage syndrome protein 1
MVNDWQNDCSLVVMETVTITIKVIDALVCQKHIVTQKYLEDCVQNITSKNQPPNPAEYVSLLNFNSNS